MGVENLLLLRILSIDAHNLLIIARLACPFSSSLPFPFAGRLRDELVLRVIFGRGSFLLKVSCSRCLFVSSHSVTHSPSQDSDMPSNDISCGTFTASSSNIFKTKVPTVLRGFIILLVLECLCFRHKNTQISIIITTVSLFITPEHEKHSPSSYSVCIKRRLSCQEPTDSLSHSRRKSMNCKQCPTSPPESLKERELGTGSNAAFWHISIKIGSSSTGGGGYKSSLTHSTFCHQALPVGICLNTRSWMVSVPGE